MSGEIFSTNDNAPLFKQRVENVLERREQRPILVSRAFVLRSATPEYLKERIASGTPLSELNFVYNIMGLKGAEAKNPNQLIPLGGVIKTERGKPMWEGEKLSSGTERELFQEGYIRGTDYHFLGREQYKHNGVPKEQILSYTTASPYDELQQLHPQEDKFAQYAYLDVAQTESLFREGKTQLPASEAQLVDSLNRSGLTVEGGGVQGPLSELKINQVERIQTKFMDALRNAEGEKKKSVLETLCRVFGKEINISDVADTLDRIQAFEKFDDVQAFYRTFIEQYPVTEAQLFESLSLSNLQEELAQLDRHGSEIEAMLRMIVILPDLQSLSPTALDMLQQSKLLKPSVVRMISRFREEDIQLDLFDEGKLSVPVLERMNALDDRDIARARAILQDTFGVDADDYFEIGQLYDSFIKYVSRETIAEKLGKEFNLSLIEQLNDVANCNPVQLLQTVAGVGPSVEKYRAERNLPELRRLVFEARRKLFIMTIISQVMEGYTEIRERGSTPIKKVWNSFQSTPHPTEIKSVLAPDGNQVIDVITSHTPDAMKRQYERMRDEGQALISMPQQDSLRTLQLNGQTVPVRVYERVIKEKDSTIRKAMMGETKSTDVFARAILVDTHDDAMLERVTKQIAVNDREQLFLQTVNDHAVVFHVMDAFTRHAQSVLGSDWKCVVKKYSPTPVGENYHYQGKRAGTGGHIRLSKFVLALERPDGREYVEEVQIFTPAFGKSGYYFFHEKAQDDEDYQLRRTLERNGIRSLVEQLFPHSVYKPIVTVHRKSSPNQRISNSNPI